MRLNLFEIRHSSTSRSKQGVRTLHTSVISHCIITSAKNLHIILYSTDKRLVHLPTHKKVVRHCFPSQSNEAFSSLFHHPATSASSSGCRGSRQHLNTLSVFLARRRAYNFDAVAAVCSTLPSVGWVAAASRYFFSAVYRSRTESIKRDVSRETRRPHSRGLY